MPVTVGILDLGEYRRHLEAHTLLVVWPTPCPACSAPLRQRGAVVRGLVVWACREEELVLEKFMLVVALAFCDVCRRQPRVLPACVLPRKTYGLPVIEDASQKYRTGTLSLRHVAGRLYGGHKFVHATLHAWTEGMGAYALGRRQGEVDDAEPASRVAVEAEARQPAIRELRPRDQRIDPRRYRSEARLDRLRACAWLILLASYFTGLTDLHARFLRWSRRGRGLGFRTGLSSTRIEHVPPQEPPPSPGP